MKLIKNQDGLSLIEIIISITIMAIMTISIIATTNQTLENRTASIEENAEFFNIETALERIDIEFSQIYTPMYHTGEFKIDPRDKAASEAKFEELRQNPLYQQGGKFSMPTFRGHPIPIYFQERNEIFSFYTKSNRRRVQNIKESEFAWVTYQFRSYRGEDENKRGTYQLVRYVDAKNIYKNDFPLLETKPFVLAENITDFKMEFWDPRSEKWVENIKQVINGDRLLRAFRLTITWKRLAGATDNEEIVSRTFRSIWPIFEPEDLNKVKYDQVNVTGGNSNQNDQAGENEEQQ